MAFVRVSPSALARTPADFAAGLKTTVAAYQRAAGRLPLVLPLGKAKGVGDLNSSFCNMLGITSGWCAQYTAQTPTLAPGSTSPGLPVGYDPSTGLINGNPSGATVANPYGVTYPAAAAVCDWTAASWLDPSTWCATNWLVVAGGAGVGLYFLLRRKR